MGRTDVKAGRFPECEHIVKALNKCNKRSFFDRWWNNACAELTHSLAACRREIKEKNRAINATKSLARRQRHEEIIKAVDESTKQPKQEEEE